MMKLDKADGWLAGLFPALAVLGYLWVDGVGDSVWSERWLGLHAFLTGVLGLGFVLRGFDRAFCGQRVKQVVVRAGLMGLALPLCGLAWLVVEERQRERVMTEFQTQLVQVKRGELEEVDLCEPEDVALFRELVRDFDPATSKVVVRDTFFSLTEVDVLTPAATYPLEIGRAEGGSGRVLARYVEKRAD